MAKRMPNVCDGGASRVARAWRAALSMNRFSIMRHARRSATCGAYAMRKPPRHGALAGASCPCADAPVRETRHDRQRAGYCPRSDRAHNQNVTTGHAWGDAPRGPGPSSASRARRASRSLPQVRGQGRGTRRHRLRPPGGMRLGLNIGSHNRGHLHHVNGFTDLHPG